MDIDEALTRGGGIATRAVLMAMCGREEFERAVRVGDVVRVARGRYAGRHVAADVGRAHALSGVLSFESAALAHGWEVLHVPTRPHVTVPAKRTVLAQARERAVVHFADLHPDEVTGSWTSRERTLGDCLRGLPFASALAVADSALRQGCSPTWLVALAAALRGPGVRQARRVARLADARAANPFESALRAICADVAGLAVRPQVPLFGGAEFLGRPDLVDEELEIVLEADSFEWHGGRSALAFDARRYNAMVVNGWLVLRFCWEDVLFDAPSVADVIRRAVDRQDQSADGRRRRPRRAVVPARPRRTA